MGEASTQQAEVRTALCVFSSMALLAHTGAGRERCCSVLGGLQDRRGDNRGLMTALQVGIKALAVA